MISWVQYRQHRFLRLTNAPRHPYEMTEEDWGIVIANNALTCGYNLVTGTVKDKDNKPELHVLGAKRSLYPGMVKFSY